MRIEELTFLRFIAASIVVIFHFGISATKFPGALISGPEMVTFFFVLSGFVMGIAYYKKSTSVSKYLWARASRILPVYFLALAMVVTSYLINHQHINPVSLGLSITLLQAWVPTYPLSLNVPGWSLSVEIFFYTSFPFLLWYIKKNSLTSKNIGFLAFFLWAITHITTTIALNKYYTGFPSVLHDIIFYLPLTHFCSFVFGLAGAMWLLDNQDKKYNEILVFICLILTFTAIIWILNNKGYITYFFKLKRLAFDSSLLAPVFLALIVLISLTRSHYIKILRFYPLVILGEASYSLYILQFPMYLFYQKYISKMLALDTTANFWVFFIFLVIISIMTFFLFEKPVNKFLRYSLPDLLKSKQ